VHAHACLSHDAARDLYEALETSGWHLIFSDLELSDFSVVDLANLLSEKSIDIPLIVIKGTGAAEMLFAASNWA